VHRRLVVRRRRWLPARPSLYWTSAVGLAVVTALVVGGLVARADSARRRWGDVEPVVVAVRSLQIGDVVEAADVAVQPWPSGLVPAGSFAEPPLGRVVTAAVYTGEALVTDRVAPDGLSGIAALLPPDTRALAVPVGPGLQLQVGDTVDVLATFDPSIAGTDEPSFAVAEAATVVAVADGAVTVAVDVADAPRVAFALSEGVVTLALRGR